MGNVKKSIGFLTVWSNLCVQARLSRAQTASANPGLTSKCLVLLNMAINKSHIRIIHYIILHMQPLANC